MSAPSNRTGFRPDAPTTAQRPRFRDKQTGIRDRKRTSTIINVDEVETYDGVADQCFIVARLIHDDVLEPQDFGRTIFVNTGDSRGGWHDISPFKAPLIIVRLLAERRECYLAVGGRWSRAVSW